MAKKTISIGGATYDVFVQTHPDALQSNEKRQTLELPLGSKVRVQNVIEVCGGGASNSSVGLARLGMDAHFCGVIGSDQWGEKLLENFRKEGVDSSFATIVEDEVSSFSIILSASSGERTILYDPGTNGHLHDANFSREDVTAMDWVYLNHIQEHSCVIQDDIVDILDNHDTVGMTWNPGGCQIDVGIDEGVNRHLLRQTDFLQLNKEEALKFTRQETVPEALKALTENAATYVCITDGGNGTVGSDGTHMYHCPVLHMSKPIVDTTGAGDAFGTGVTWALAQGKDLPEAMRAGTINAASVVRSFGAQAGLLTDIKMNTALTEHQLDVETHTLS